MRILITGATSFIGKHLVKELVRCFPNNQYIGICNHSPNDNEIKELDLYYTDLANPQTENIVANYFKPDLVYHLAAISNPNYSSVKTIWDTNVNGTLYLLKGIKCPIVFASTANILGGYPHYKEELTTIYAATKRAAECLIEGFARQDLCKGVSIRLTGVVGPNMSHGLLPVLIKKSKEQQNPMELLRDTRKTYIHIEDVVNQFIYYADSYNWDTNPKYQQHTMSNKDSLSTTEVANLVYGFFNSGSFPQLKYSNVSYSGDIDYSNPKHTTKKDLIYPSSSGAILKALESYR